MPPRKPRRKATAGSFKPGFDPRRHTFTTQECRMGYWVACMKNPHLREWIQLKVRLHRRAKENPHVPQREEETCGA